jgi:hypothetical protein
MLAATQQVDTVLKWFVEHPKRFWTIEEIIQESSYSPLTNDIDIQLLHIILERLTMDVNKPNRKPTLLKNSHHTHNAVINSFCPFVMYILSLIVSKYPSLYPITAHHL